MRPVSAMTVLLAAFLAAAPVPQGGLAAGERAVAGEERVAPFLAGAALDPAVSGRGSGFRCRSGSSPVSPSLPRS